MPQGCNRTIDADDGPVTGGWGWTTRDIRNHRLSIPRAGGRRATQSRGTTLQARRRPARNPSARDRPAGAPSAGAQPRRAGGSARARGIRVLHSPHSRAHARHPMIIAERLFAARCRGILANSQRPTPNSDAESRWLAEKFARPAGRPDRFAIRKTFG